MDWLPGALIILAFPGYLYLQSRAFNTYRGACQLAAMVPFAGIGAVAGYTTVGLFAGANLWPLLFVLACPLACGYLAILDIVDWYTAA